MSHGGSPCQTLGTGALAVVSGRRSLSMSINREGTNMSVQFTVTLTPERERNARALGSALNGRYDAIGDIGPQMTHDKRTASALATAAVEQHLDVSPGTLAAHGYCRAWTPIVNAKLVIVGPWHDGLLFSVVGPLPGYERPAFRLTGPVPTDVLRRVEDDGSHRPSWQWRIEDFMAEAALYRETH